MDNITFICISLQKDIERRKEIEKTFEKLGINNRIEWWIVEKHPDGGIYGCFESHWFVWHHKWETKYICVFEDDAKLNIEVSNPDEILKKIIKKIPKFLKNKDILFLSNDPLAYEKNFFYKNKYFNIQEGKFIGLLGYIIEPDVFCKYVDVDLKYSYGYEIDICLSELVRHISVSPPLIYQNYENSNVSLLRKGIFQKIFTQNFMSTKNHNLEAGNYTWYSFVQYSIKLFPRYGWENVEFKNRKISG